MKEDKVNPFYAYTFYKAGLSKSITQGAQTQITLKESNPKE